MSQCSTRGSPGGAAKAYPSVSPVSRCIIGNRGRFSSNSCVPISTAAVMRDAMARGATVLKIDASNVARLDELAHVSAGVKQEISRAVNERGATVLIPESETTIGGWTGVGYIIDEGSTIDYRISGGLNGGVIGATLADAATSPYDWATRVLPCLLPWTILLMASTWRRRPSRGRRW